MLVITLAILVGLAIGFLSFYYQTLVLASAASLFASAKVWFVLTVILGSPIAGELSETGQSHGVVVDSIILFRAIYEAMPVSLQLGIFLFLPVCIILGRLLTWLHYNISPDTALPLTEAARRERTLQRFSLKRRTR